MRSMRNGVPVTSESVRDVRKIWPPPSPRDPSMVSIRSALHAHDLSERVHDLDQILLRVHDRVDRLVRRRRLVDDAGILSALDALGRLDMILDAEAALGLRPRHRAAGAVAATGEALRVALAAHDVRARAHAARNDAEITL